MYIDNPIDEDIYLKIRYIYYIELKKIDSFSKELLNFKYDKKLLLYIKNYIKEINDTIYSKDNRRNTIEFENSLLVGNNFINLEIVFYALNKLIKKRIPKKEVKKEEIDIKKIKLYKKFEDNRKLITKLDYKRFIDKLDFISLALFIRYAIECIKNKSN